MAGDAFTPHCRWLQRADQAPWGPTLVINCSLELLAFEWSLLAGRSPPSSVLADVVAYSVRTVVRTGCDSGAFKECSRTCPRVVGYSNDNNVYLGAAHSTVGG